MIARSFLPLMRTVKVIRVSLLVSTVVSVSAFAADSNLRAFEHADLSDPQTLIECMAAMKRAGQRITVPPAALARLDQGLLQEIAGRVLVASRERGSELAHLNDIHSYNPKWVEEARGWYHPGARELRVGDQFETRKGNLRWTKIYQSDSARPPLEGDGQAFPPGGREVWLAPNGNLVGDVVGRMTHYDAQRIDRALKVLFEQAETTKGVVWKWPLEINGKPFDAASFLKLEMEREVPVNELPGGDPRGIQEAERHVGRYYDSLLDSVGRLLEPDFPWRLPEQVGDGIDRPGPTRQMSELRQFGALEVLPGFQEGTQTRWFWPSSVSAAGDSNSALSFSGGYGFFGNLGRDCIYTSVRLIARPRPAPKSSGENQ